MEQENVKFTFVYGIVTYAFEPKYTREKLENWVADDNTLRPLIPTLRILCSCGQCEVMSIVEICRCWKHCNYPIRNMGELGCIYLTITGLFMNSEPIHHFHLVYLTYDEIHLYQCRYFDCNKKYIFIHWQNSKTFLVIIFFLDVYYISIHYYRNNINLKLRRNKAL